ncbi:terminase small subunit [Nonomuraea mesophila]|uniref:terminase small subunit n=1 Tax=Nonomuraea mesophila TaxID=2530382 RepID=UPI001C708039|nr:hypothetical protein [Nonomuraea mesophila]
MPPRRRKLAAVSDPPARDRAPDLRDAVRAALDGMTWLDPSDQAMRALALRQAEEIEKAVDRAAELDELRRELAGDMAALKRLQKLEAMCEITKTVGWLGPQLQGVLRDLGGTPAARKAMQGDKPIGGRLAQLRANAAAREDDA